MKSNTPICSLCGEDQFEVTELKKDSHEVLSSSISFSTPTEERLFKFRCLCCGKLELSTLPMPEVVSPKIKWMAHGFGKEGEYARYKENEVFVHLVEGSNKKSWFFKSNPKFQATLNLVGGPYLHKKQFDSREEAKQWCEKWLQYR